MQPFDVLIPSVPDPDLGPLLTDLTSQGFDPVVTPTGDAGTGHGGFMAAQPADAFGLPTGWELVKELDGQSYRWPQPEEREKYTRYRVFAGTLPSGKKIHIALGDAERTEVFGQARPYVIAFLTSGSPRYRSLSSWAWTTSASREYISIIRGKGDSKKMFDPGDVLPPLYGELFTVVTYRDRVQADGAYSKLAVVATESDDMTKLNHAALQAHRRGEI